MDLRRGVGGGELAGQVGEVCEGELARVAALADAQEDNVVLEEVVQGEGVAVDGGLGSRVAVQLAQYLAHLAFHFGEGGFRVFIVDRGAEHEACVIVSLPCNSLRHKFGSCVR